MALQALCGVLRGRGGWQATWDGNTTSWARRSSQAFGIQHKSASGHLLGYHNKTTNKNRIRMPTWREPPCITARPLPSFKCVACQTKTGPHSQTEVLNPISDIPLAPPSLMRR